jgi:hypothetical protein
MALEHQIVVRCSSAGIHMRMQTCRGKEEGITGYGKNAMF